MPRALAAASHQPYDFCHLAPPKHGVPGTAGGTTSRTSARSSIGR